MCSVVLTLKKFLFFNNYFTFVQYHKLAAQVSWGDGGHLEERKERGRERECLCVFIVCCLATQISRTQIF